MFILGQKVSFLDLTSIYLFIYIYLKFMVKL